MPTESVAAPRVSARAETHRSSRGSASVRSICTVPRKLGRSGTTSSSTRSRVARTSTGKPEDGDCPCRRSRGRRRLRRRWSRRARGRRGRSGGLGARGAGGEHQRGQDRRSPHGSGATTALRRWEPTPRSAGLGATAGQRRRDAALGQLHHAFCGPDAILRAQRRAGTLTSTAQFVEGSLVQNVSPSTWTVSRTRRAVPAARRNRCPRPVRRPHRHGGRFEHQGAGLGRGGHRVLPCPAGRAGGGDRCQRSLPRPAASRLALTSCASRRRATGPTRAPASTWSVTERSGSTWSCSRSSPGPRR